MHYLLTIGGDVVIGVAAFLSGFFWNRGIQDSVYDAGYHHGRADAFEYISKTLGPIRDEETK